MIPVRREALSVGLNFTLVAADHPKAPSILIPPIVIHHPTIR